MLLNSMAAACLQFIWVAVRIPNHSHHFQTPGPKDVHAQAPLSDNNTGLLLKYNNRCTLVPETAPAVQVSITGVTA